MENTRYMYLAHKAHAVENGPVGRLHFPARAMCVRERVGGRGRTQVYRTNSIENTGVQNKFFRDHIL